jgi:flagellin
MGEITENLQRMRELAVQSANGTNGTADRTALNTEFTALADEINRAATATTFNDNLLFSGSYTAGIQIGANSTTASTANAYTIGGASLINVATSSLGSGSVSTGSGEVSVTYRASTLNAGYGATTEIVVNGTGIAANANVGSGANFASTFASQIQAADGNITATVGESRLSIANTTADEGLGAFTTITGASGDLYTLSVNGVAVIAGLDVSTTTFDAEEMDARFAGVQADLAAAGIEIQGTIVGGDFALVGSDGRNIVFSETYSDAANMGGGFAVSQNDGTTTSAVVTTGTGSVTLTSEYNIGMTGTNLNKIDKDLTAGATDVTSASTSTSSATALGSNNISTVAAAQAALLSVDRAFEQISAARASAGAELSRLDSIGSSQMQQIENYSAARSRVRDADFAVESADLARTQVLQQAGISVLSQANAMPQQVLALLQ